MTRIGDTPLGEFVHAAVHNFGFVATERLAFGEQLTETFTSNDELLYLFLNVHDAFLPSEVCVMRIFSMRLNSGSLFALPRVFQFFLDAIYRVSRSCSSRFE